CTVPSFDSSGTSQARARLSALEKISQGERQVFGVGLKSAADRREHIDFSHRSSEFLSEVTQSDDLAFANDSFSFFRDYTEMAVNSVVIARQRTVGEGVISLLGIAAAFKKKHEGFVPRGHTGFKYSLNARTDLGPYFGPDFLRTFA